MKIGARVRDIGRFEGVLQSERPDPRFEQGLVSSLGRRRKGASSSRSTTSAAIEIDLLIHRKIGSRGAYGNSPQFAGAIL
jgi:hypothetical protein